MTKYKCSEFEDNTLLLSRFSRWLYRKRISDGQIPSLVRYGNSKRWQALRWYANDDSEPTEYRKYRRVV